MQKEINIYCDETCHLEGDRIPVMGLGGIWVSASKTRGKTEKIREIKKKYGLSPSFEIKWVKVSPAKLDFYAELFRYFFDDPDLHFRAVMIPNKSELDHETFTQDHNIWYYKMWFVMLKQILRPEAAHKIYLDIKDTHGQEKIEKLHEVLCNNVYDFDRKIVTKIQQVRSHEIEILQLADLLLGCLGYLHRGLQSSQAKTALVELFRSLSGLQLTQTTLPQSHKVNILVWRPQMLEI